MKRILQRQYLSKIICSRIDFVIAIKKKKKKGKKNTYICINLIASIQIEFLLNKKKKKTHVISIFNILKTYSDKIHQKSIYIRNIVKYY